MNLYPLQFNILLDLTKSTFKLSFSTVKYIEMVCQG